MTPLTISASVNPFLSARWRAAMDGISAASGCGHDCAAIAMATRASAIRRGLRTYRCVIGATLPQAMDARKQRGPSAGLVLDDDRGSDGDTVIEIDDVVIGHAEAAG